MVKIKFSNEKKEVEMCSGSEFLEIHGAHPDLPLKFGCKRGECGTCTIKILKGMENLTKMSAEEQETLRKKNCDHHYRLACQCAVNGFVEIE